MERLALPTNLELIDTLWNVNNLTISLFPFRTAELIDTLWNVNYISPR